MADEATALEAEEKERLEQMKACEAAEVKAEKSLAEAYWHLLQVTSCALKRLVLTGLLCSCFASGRIFIETSLCHLR